MEIKKNLEEYFKREDISQMIIQYLEKNNLSYEQLDDKDIQQMLQKMQLLDPILTEMNKNTEEQKISEIQTNKPIPQFQNVNQTTLSLTIEEGRKFKSNLTCYICVSGFKKRILTKQFKLGEKVIINEILSFTLFDMIITNTNNLQLCLVHVEGKTKRIIAIKLIQWRLCLCYGKMTFDIELAPYQNERINEVQSLGILSLRMHITPLSKLNMVSERMLNTQLNLQKKQKQQANNLFYSSAQQFYNEYKDLNKQFIHRRIKLYTLSEDNLLIPTQSNVYPLYKIRGIESPNHALRFVSLIPFLASKFSEQKTRRFNNMILGCSLQDHCHLLCSLLLGLGLKSYVCLGESVNGRHAWVATQYIGSLLFWECTKGVKHDYLSKLGFYKAIHVVYNHQQYYANVQKDASIVTCKMNFKDPTLWKKMDCVPNYDYNRQLQIRAPTIDAFQCQQNIEKKIISRIKNGRQTHKLKFEEDEIISSILTTALTNYESERLTGVTYCEQQFQSAIKQHIPLKHTFKACPMQINSLDPEIIFQKMNQNEAAKSIIMTKGEKIYFGFRCKVVLFPQNLFTVWISLAVRYFQIRQK